MLDHLLQTQSLRSAIRNCQHIHAKSIFQLCLLIEHICKILYICVTLQVKNNTDSLFGRLVGNIHDICCLLVFHKRRNIIQEFSDICPDHCVRNLCDHKLLSAAFELHCLHLTSDTELPCSCLINPEQVILIYYQTASREIRSFDDLHDLFDRGLIFIFNLVINNFHNRTDDFS